ncbi:hypothetical protein [Bradyrhizobium lablabi]|nr:hypothetical protein [Bradyrhizobium lablabi]
MDAAVISALAALTGTAMAFSAEVDTDCVKQTRQDRNPELRF